ncbi:MAG: amidohydrolase family protein, partial [Gemmatimonadales bacterium]
VKTYTRITPEIMTELVDEASALQLRVAAHLGLTDAATAARIGVRSIEHLSGVPEAALRNPEPLYAAHRRSFFDGWTAFEASWAGLDSTILSLVARQLANARIFLVPTLVLHETYSRLDDSTLYAEAGLAAVPDSIRERWNVPGMIGRAGWNTREFEAFRRSRPNQDLFLREFIRAGGVAVAGTDASNQMLVPGLSLHQEMELMVRAGLTSPAALLAATRNAARLLGADSLGAVIPGGVADLLVLSANPLDDISNTRQVELVVLRGQMFSPDSIRGTW